MNQDVKLLIDIYKRYLNVTSDLVEILERNYDKVSLEKNGLQAKRKEFIKHGHKVIEEFNADLHKLLRLSWELKDIEESYEERGE